MFKIALFGMIGCIVLISGFFKSGQVVETTKVVKTGPIRPVQLEKPG